MKRCLSLILVCILAFGTVSATAGEAAKEPGIRQQVTDVFTQFGSWLGGVAESAENALDTAAKWTESHWDEIVETASEIADGAKEAAENAWQWTNDKWQALLSGGKEMKDGIGAWITETWNSLYGAVQTRFQHLFDIWSEAKLNSDTYSQMFVELKKFSQLLTYRETAAMVEEAAEAAQVDLPEDVRAAIESLRQAAASESADAKLEDPAIIDFLPQVGLDRERFEAKLGKRIEDRALKIAIEAESAYLNDYLSKNGLSFTSPVLRAQDRLDRYAAGQLSMSDEELGQAVTTITKWVDTVGIDLRRMVEKAAQE